VPSAAAAAGAGSAVKLVVLYDDENAHTAFVPLASAARVAASAAVGWRMMVFVGKATTEVQASAKVEVIRVLTESQQASETQLCFNAGVNHKYLPARD
jgi:hypothetical protein